MPIGAARFGLLGGIADLGKLELLQTTTISSSIPAFTSLSESTYNVHLFTFTGIHFGSQSEFGYQLSDDGGSTYETSYHFANRRITEQSSVSDRKSTGQATARLFGDISNNALSAGNGYMYLYNAGISSKYTFASSVAAFRDASDKCAIEFGQQVYATSSTIDAVRFGLGLSVGTIVSGVISCYGIAES